MQIRFSVLVAVMATLITLGGCSPNVDALVAQGDALRAEKATAEAKAIAATAEANSLRGQLVAAKGRIGILDADLAESKRANGTLTTKLANANSATHTAKGRVAYLEDLISRRHVADLPPSGRQVRK